MIGRFLEHSRVFHFGNGGAAEYYIGSADWMPRNLERRVEVIVPVEDPGHQARLARLLESYLRDNRQAWVLRPDGSYVQLRPASGESDRGTHEVLVRDAWGQARQSGPMRVVTGPPDPLRPDPASHP